MSSSSSLAHESKVRELFDTKATTWKKKYDGILRHRLELFMDNLDVYCRPGGAVLDFGCGSGIYLVEVARRNYRATGLDISAGMLEQCRRNLVSDGIEATLIRGSVEQVSDGPERFDAIICSSVFEYVPHPLRILEKLHGCLVDDGVLLLTVPNRESIQRIREARLKGLIPLLRLFRFMPKISSYLRYLEVSINRFNWEELAFLANDAGFRIEKQLYFDAARGARADSNCRESAMIFCVLRK